MVSSENTLAAASRLANDLAALRAESVGTIGDEGVGSDAHEKRMAVARSNGRVLSTGMVCQE